MDIKSYLTGRLEEGGWRVRRNGKKHQVWELPDGQVFTLGVGSNTRDSCRRRINYLKQIERAEKAYKLKLNPPPAVAEEPKEEEPIMKMTPATLPAIAETLIDGKPVNAVNARDLHAYLEVRKDFSDWIKVQVERARLVEHKHFEKVPQKGELSATGQIRIDYLLSLDAAKHIGMIAGTDKGFELRDYFIENDKKLTAILTAAPAPVNPYLAMNRRDLLYMAIEQDEKIEELGCKVQALDAKVLEQDESIQDLIPQAKALGLIAETSEGAMNLRESAKLLQQAPLKFNKDLERLGWIYRTNGRNVAYQDKIRQGWMEHKFVHVQRGDGPVEEVPQPLITPKGIVKLAVLFGVAS